MAREPQRAAQPRPLNAAVVPVERALLARAAAIQGQVDAIVDNEGDDDEGKLLTAHALATVAEEFRALAEELHYW